MIRFGIEAAESDDEDAEEALANAIRDRNLIDAHNMGLSVSIEALAEQPEAVVLKTARSLGVSTETAAKILTSVGMSLLMRSNGHDKDVFAEPRPSSSSSRDLPVNQQQTQAQAGTSATAAGPVASTSAQSAINGVATPAEANNNVSKTFTPVLGDFAPSGEADLCVVVGATDAPAPSPFSARKRRTRSSTRNFVSVIVRATCAVYVMLTPSSATRHTRHQLAEDSLSHRQCQAIQPHQLADITPTRQKNHNTTSSWSWTTLSIQVCCLPA